MTHIYVGNLTTTGSVSSLLPGRRPAIIWTNARILLIFIQENAFESVVCEMTAILSRPYCFSAYILLLVYSVINLRCLMTLSMETFSALLSLCKRNPPVTVGLPSQRPVTWSFDVIFDLHLNNSWANGRGTGDFRRHRAHYDVIVMWLWIDCMK